MAKGEDMLEQFLETMLWEQQSCRLLFGPRSPPSDPARHAPDFAPVQFALPRFRLLSSLSSRRIRGANVGEPRTNDHM
jgi:hypothetical protein